MSLFADRTVTHCARAESFYDFTGRFDLIEWYWFSGYNLEKPPQGVAYPSLVIDGSGVIIIGLLIVMRDSVLKLRYRNGVPEMLLAVVSEMIVAAKIQIEHAARRLLKSGIMTGDYFLRDVCQANPADSRAGSSEVFIHERAIQPNRFEKLSAGIAAQCGNPHFAHRLQDALLDGGDVIVCNLGGFHIGRQVTFLLKIVECLEGEIGVDRITAESTQKTVMHDLSWFGTL